MKRIVFLFGILAIVGLFVGGCTKVDDLRPMIQEGDHDYFTIGVGKQVVFAPGNLAEDGRSFVEHQWESGGLFGWGTGNNPGLTSTDWQDYITYCDWGDSIEGEWRTLTSDEWNWVLWGRNDAHNKWALGTVNGVHGLVLLPGKWTLPEGCSFTPKSIGYEHNVYSPSQWQQMEAAGAVFLPAAGYREGSTVYDGSQGGTYWTSTPAPWTKGGAYFWSFDFDIIILGGFNHSYIGRSVRLVHDVK